MTDATSAANPAWVWSDWGDAGAAITPSPLPVDRDSPVVFGVVAGTLTLVVRAIRGDGRLGSPEPVIEVGSGAILAIPPDEPGWTLELRRSHDARVRPLGGEGDMTRTVDLESLADAIRPAFDTSAELVAWSADLAAADPTPTWSAIHRRLAEVMRDCASRAVADALTHARDRIERLHQLDDESLDEAIRVMADTRTAAAGGVATTIGIADDRRAILRVIESLGIDVGPALDLDIRPDADAAAQIARRLHLQHREVRLDGR